MGTIVGIEMAFTGALGIACLSFLLTRTARYIVGIGMSGSGFLALSALSLDVEMTLFLSVMIGIFCYLHYDLLMLEDLYTGVFMLVIAVIGLIILTFIVLHFLQSFTEQAPSAFGASPHPLSPRWMMETLRMLDGAL